MYLRVEVITLIKALTFLPIKTTELLTTIATIKIPLYTGNLSTIIKVSRNFNLNNFFTSYNLALSKC